MKKLQRYKDLLTKSYSEVITYLLTKYGAAKDDYYRKSSYERFLSGSIKNITRGEYSRTDEGLYCHHIDEIEILNISNKDVILSEEVPFDYQKKERLVYCDLIEHTILHVLIAKETSGDFGLPGYQEYLKPMIEEWYIEEKVPNRSWMKKCYHKAFLTPKEAVCIIKRMQDTLGLYYVNSPREYHREYHQKVKEMHEKRLQKMIEDRMKIDSEFAEQVKQRERTVEKARKELEKREKITFNQKVEEFYTEYPIFKDLNIRFDTPRKKVLKMMYEYKYNKKYNNFKEFNKSMMPVVKEELLRELYTILSR